MPNRRSDKFNESAITVKSSDLVEIDFDSIFNRPEPLPNSARRANSRRRAAKSHSPQLVILGIDDSRSMSHDGKAEAATEAVKDMIYEMTIRSDGASYFQIVLFSFGDYVNYNDRTFGVPVLEFDDDEVEFDGSSGRTNFFRPFSLVESVLQHYESSYLRFHEKPMSHPVPLFIFMSDGQDRGKEDPCPIAERIKTMQMSTGAPPLILTVGIEFGGDKPDEVLLKRLASTDDESNRPAYFDVSNAKMLAQFLARAGSSGSSTAGEIFRAIGNLD